MIEIKAFIKNSLLDWDGKVVCVVYLPGCNFRCPFCHNMDLVLTPENLKNVEFEEVADYIKQNISFIDGICVTGGEPCRHEDLTSFLTKIRTLKVMVKLDTNGSYPERLKEIIGLNLIDYAAMDIKAPLERADYFKACGIENNEIISKVKKSIAILMTSNIDYEFRTTVVPGLHTKKEILQIAAAIKGAKKFALQNFSNYKTLNPDLERVKPYLSGELEQMSQALGNFVKKCVIRG